MSTINPNPWPYSYIQQLAEEAAVTAKLRGLTPAVARQVYANWKTARRFNIPFLGEYVPDNWVRLDQDVPPFFVDCTGRKRPGQPGGAITAFEFSKRIEEWIRGERPYAFGILEMGQTQVLMAVYRKE